MLVRKNKGSKSKMKYLEDEIVINVLQMTSTSLVKVFSWNKENRFLYTKKKSATF